jgi:hypothetical protein
LRLERRTVAAMGRKRGVLGVFLAAAGLALIVAVAGGSSASAVPPDGYATWTLTATPGGGYTGTATLPVGFPGVQFTTDSRVPAAISGGTAAWISPGVGLGTIAGSSRSDQYVSIRPKVDTGTPSTTVFTFGANTPIGGWGFAVGDIDAEIVTVSATDSTGSPVAAAALGLQTFNYCDNSFGTSSCASSPFTAPIATPATNSISVQDPNCTAVSATGTCDTNGESFWISPTVSLATLTVVSQGKSGFPSYQAWFAVAPRAISGTATTDCAVTQPLSAQLVDGAGNVVAASAVAAGGTFGFPLIAARADYSVRFDPATLPAGALTPATPTDVSAASVTGVVVASTCPAVVTPPVVTPPPTVVADPAVPTLAATGTDPRLPLAAGILLVAVGVALRLPRRRPRH